MLQPEDVMLIKRLHGDLPLTDRPFADVAAEFGWTEDTVIERLRLLLAHGELTRFGPLFQIERAGGNFVLAAIAVPEERFDAVTAQVNAFPEVAHNYRRAHPLNMWFVVAGETPEITAGRAGTHRGRDRSAGAGVSEGTRVLRRAETAAG
jgi:DNA-binding Lrp family transcriptional regulator